MDSVLLHQIIDFGEEASIAFHDEPAVTYGQLRREVAKLKAERDILKKAAAYFAKDVT